MGEEPEVVERYWRPELRNCEQREIDANKRAEALQADKERLEAALNEIGDLERYTRHGGAAPEDLQDLDDALNQAVQIVVAALAGSPDPVRDHSGDANEMVPDLKEAVVKAAKSMTRNKARPQEAVEAAVWDACDALAKAQEQAP